MNLGGFSEWQSSQACLGRRAVLEPRVSSQLVGRPVTDSRHRAAETQATNLHPPSFFSFMLTGIPV